MSALLLVVGGCSGDVGTLRADDPALPPSAPSTEPDGSATVTLVHPFTRDQDLRGLRAVITAFETVNPALTVDDEMVEDPAVFLADRPTMGAPPDVIISSRPDLFEDLLEAGTVIAVDGLLDVAALESSIVGGLLEVVTFDGTLAAAPLRVSPRSLVWFNPSVFAARGYEIPTSWDAMIALGDTMRREGLAPWCIGIESGPATGWIVADWVEDVILRGLGGAAYDRWVAGDLAFASPEVQGILAERLVPVWSDANIFGGRELMARQAFAASALGILGDDPDCGMHRQTLIAEDLIRSAAPDVRFGTDYDFFALPPMSDGRFPMIGDAAFVAVTSVEAGPASLLRFLTSPEAGERWGAGGASLSPFVASSDATALERPSAARASEVLRDVTEFRLDGSDLMPAEVGASALPGSFWSEMAAWARDERPLAEALENVDELFARHR